MNLFTWCFTQKGAEMARPQHERQKKGRSVPGRDKKNFSLTPRRAQQSPQYQAEVKNEWSYAYTVPCVQTAPQKLWFFKFADFAHVQKLLMWRVSSRRRFIFVISNLKVSVFWSNWSHAPLTLSPKWLNAKGRIRVDLILKRTLHALHQCTTHLSYFTHKKRYLRLNLWILSSPSLQIPTSGAKVLTDVLLCAPKKTA